MGDCHAAQGDSEFDGTAIETSMTAKIKVTVIKKGKEPKFLKDLDFPLIENANEWVVTGLTYKVSS
jgi:acetamidase/formamidase